MSPAKDFRVAVLPGDGIGQEITRPCTDLLDAALRRANAPRIHWDWLEAGAETYRTTGCALPAATLDGCRRADAILLAAMGLPSVRYPDGTEISPQIDLRFEFGLYGGVRPIRAIPGVPPRLSDPRAADIDFVLIRESTEGLFASRGKGVVEDDREARDTLVITRATSERLFDFSFRLAEQRRAAGGRGRVTCVDKANVFASFAFFRKIFDERAAAFPQITADHAYVDATALMMVLHPWSLDVLVTENMFGDILSDLGPGLIGGLGLAPSADMGDEAAVFQPTHGTAPDIAGRGIANPLATVLSAAMLLEWLGDRHGDAAPREAGRRLHRAVEAGLAAGRLLGPDLGGDLSTQQIGDRVVELVSGAKWGAGGPG